MIRKMTERDVPGVHKLELECFSAPWSEMSLKKEVNNEQSLFYVCEEDGEIAGYAGMYLICDEGDITNVAVSEKYRGRKIATEILKKMFEDAKTRGVHKFTLEVRKSNSVAIGLYERLGFAAEGCRKNFYTDPAEDGLIMWKR